MNLQPECDALYSLCTSPSNLPAIILYIYGPSQGKDPKGAFDIKMSSIQGGLKETSNLEAVCFNNRDTSKNSRPIIV